MVFQIFDFAESIFVLFYIHYQRQSFQIFFLESLKLALCWLQRTPSHFPHDVILTFSDFPAFSPLGWNTANLCKTRTRWWYQIYKTDQRICFIYCQTYSEPSGSDLSPNICHTCSNVQKIELNRYSATLLLANFGRFLSWGTQIYQHYIPLYVQVRNLSKTT